ncbi:TonB C terminal [Formivibrio citricus]|uniref:TonB C terminal n=1 Tax=Formivibrio citricus TaxID=83765 RepID=A0A1I4ZH62_9NEIS|nr:energy transducer TonB [Formivibrio citricus]SFN49606.1 TonB C terminal [Formivibrio citricus]
MQAIDEHRFFERDERRGVSFVLALAVHLLLVVFLFVSVQWRTQRVESVDVELWGGPPPAQERVVVQQTKPQPKVKEPEPEPEPVRKPDIVQEKAKPKPKEKPQPQPASPVKAEKKPEKKKPAEQGMEGLLDLANLSKARDARPNGRPGGTGTNPKAVTNNAGAGAGGGGRPGDNYLGQVVRLIKSNTVYAGNKQTDSRAQVKVFLLPDGTVREAQVVKKSGDPAYAEAARRAVITTQKFPPLPGGKSFSSMREWTLTFCAREDIRECKL